MRESGLLQLCRISLAQALWEYLLTPSPPSHPPQAVSFALLAKLPATVGLFAAFWIGAIASIFGGRPGMISGATGAMAAVMPTYGE